MQVFDVLWALAVLPLIINCDAEPSRLESYNSQRDEFFRNEQKIAFGANVTLNHEEIRANQIIMDAKTKEFNEAFNAHRVFIPSRPISETLAKINESTLFKYISEMPKGAVLHAHDRALCSIDCIMKITYLPNSVICQNKRDKKLAYFKFSKELPKSNNRISCAHLATLRKGQSKEVDDTLRQELTLNLNDSSLDRQKVWKKFKKIYSVVDSLLLYAPAWKEYFNNSLGQFLADGVQYFEFRSALPIVSMRECDYDGAEKGI